MADSTSRNEALAADDLELVYRSDYRPPSFLIEKTALEFNLLSDKVVVSSRLSIVRNSAAEAPNDADLVLDGESLSLISISLDGQKLDAHQYQPGDGGLVVKQVPDRFELATVVEIDPASNLSLEGLYLSNGSYCTQCEAEGFRRITYYLDRPDVMSTFTTKIEANKASFPQLLSNGNKVDSGDLGDGRHWVLWEDPHKKPSYLFALVAAKLEVLEDHYVTMSGRSVCLQIYADEQDLDKCHHAMLSLKNAMAWDEKTYGREYDLDLYMIVAVSFFNMGAMENKGLNIFNTSCVLAHPKTQTDAAFQRVEAVVAHEYFHNWSGNRVTCRDWFQLSLKEGFTVYRDACFSAEMNSATVKRIEDVQVLRTMQFTEDAGPMAHPIRPDSYSEISNFYTLTIYEKGAEIIRMQNQLLGAEAFRAGTDLYFSRHDGQAVTCEDFVQALEDASNVDLKQFRHWYEQAGTPRLQISDDWNAETGVYGLTVEQHCEPTPGQPEKPVFHIPLALGFICGDEYREDLEQVLDITRASERFDFSGFSQKPVPALLRGFSAPVKLSFDYTADDLLSLIANERDGFTRWDAAQRYYGQLLENHLNEINDIDSDTARGQASALFENFSNLIESGWRESKSADGAPMYKWDNKQLDAATLAEILTVPSFKSLLEPLHYIPVQALIEFRESILKQYAHHLAPKLREVYQRLNQQLKDRGEYHPLADDIALRSLKNLALHYLLVEPTAEAISWAKEQYRTANNMTDQYAALTAVVYSRAQDCLQLGKDLLIEFIEQWKDEDLVVNQWLSVQATRQSSDTLEQVQLLAGHPLYDATNPNKVRSLVGAFCNTNFIAFHEPAGKAYEFLADEVLRIDQFNAQVASRMVTPLTHWKRYTTPQSDLMRNALKRVSKSSMSSDLNEIVIKALT